MFARSGAVVFGMLGICFWANAAEKANVILIVIDDLGRNDLGCYGSTFYHTPHIDRLAAEGVRFTHAYAACPVCSPTRAALMTGKYPARLHVTDWLPGRPDRPDQKLARPVIPQQLALEEITLAEALHAAGYTTAHVGKWHLGGTGFEPQRQGFDHNIAGDHTGTPLSYFAPFRNKERFMPGLEQAPANEYLTDRLTAEAEKIIEANQNKPFFLYLAHYAVHTPLRAKPALMEKYKNTRRPGTQNNAIYAAMIESMDESVGRIRKKLAELKLDRKTIVVFTSDNGGLCTAAGQNTPATTNAPLREGKGYLYEGGIRAPFLIAWPGTLRPAANVATPICSIDVMPTLLEMCGVTSAAKSDGVSIAPLVRGEAAPSRDALYWHYPHYADQGSSPSGAIRSGAWKLIEFYEHGRRELYNLAADESESRNRAADEPRIVADLAARLDSWRKSVQAQMPTPNPKYLPNPQAVDGAILLHARTARVHGTQLRYEPQPHKNTLGFWTHVEDHASWEFTITRPGRFSVEVLQGCGAGQGGSTAALTASGQTLTFTVVDTGGFQQFQTRTIGELVLDRPGRQSLSIRATKKAAAAVMDVRSITLKPKSE